MGSIDNTYSSIINERLLILTRGANLRGITRRICLRLGSSLRSGYSLCIYRLWSGPSSLGPHSIELSEHLHSKKAKLLTEVLCSCVSSLQVTSLSALSLILASIQGAHTLFCPMPLRRLSISSDRAACSCHRARSFLLVTTQSMHLVKRVISAVQLTYESTIHLFRLHWEQRNFKVVEDRGFPKPVGCLCFYHRAWWP